MPQKTQRRDVTDLARVIEMIVSKCRDGLPALLGRKQRPSDTNVYDMLQWNSNSGESAKVKHDINTDKIANLAIRKTEFDAVIDHAGWENIVKAMREFSKSPMFDRDWRAFKGYHTAMTLRNGYTGDGCVYERLAAETEMSSSRVRRCIKRVPSQIAALALSGLSLFDDEF